MKWESESATGSWPYHQWGCMMQKAASFRHF